MQRQDSEAYRAEWIETKALEVVELLKDVNKVRSEFSDIVKRASEIAVQNGHTGFPSEIYEAFQARKAKEQAQ